MARLMKEWTIDTFGASNLKVTERRVPEPGAGEVLVRTTAVSLNFRDKLVLENGMGMPLAFLSCRVPTWPAWSKRSAAASRGLSRAIV